jgi:hypothetical protein
MADRPVGIVLDFKRKRVVTVTARDKAASRDLADALSRRVKATQVTTAGVAPPPPEPDQQ